MSDFLVGIISDTHGLLRPQALAALAGGRIILHAGDVGDAELLDRLAGIAPTFAVRGNVDVAGACAKPPATATVAAGGLIFHVLHDLVELGVDPAAAGFAAVVSGHSHRPSIKTRDGVVYLNPGSAGPRRFKRPVTIARVFIAGRQLQGEIVTLETT